MAIEFDLRDPQNQRTLAVFMSVAVLMYGLYHFKIKPMTGELQRGKTEIATLKTQLNAMRTNLQAKKNLLAEKDRLALKLDELDTYLPEKENVALLLDQFSLVENATKVYVVGFKANETVDDAAKPYLSNKYKVTVEVGYHQFVDFMSGIMALPRILSFSEMKIAQNTNAPERRDMNEGLEDQPRSLSIECSITTYVFKGAGEEATKGASGETAKAKEKKP